MRKLMSFIGLLLPFAVQAAPVDGYKDLKFGMSLEQVKATNKLCESEWHIPEEDNPMKVVAGFMICDKFAFNTGYIRAELRFIGNNLKLIILKLPEYPHYPKKKLIPLLTAKYGEPVVVEEDLIEEKIKQGKIKKRGKNETLLYEEYNFANGTVSFGIFNENGKDDRKATIYYRSPDFINSSAEWQNELEKQFLINEL